MTTELTNRTLRKVSFSAACFPRSLSSYLLQCNLVTGSTYNLVLCNPFYSFYRCPLIILRETAVASLLHNPGHEVLPCSLYMKSLLPCLRSNLHLGKTCLYQHGVSTSSGGSTLILVVMVLCSSSLLVLSSSPLSRYNPSRKEKKFHCSFW